MGDGVSIFSLLFLFVGPSARKETLNVQRKKINKINQKRPKIRNK